MSNIAMVFRALGNDTRLAIVRELARRDQEVPSCDILTGCSKALKLAQPTMSQHFAKLVAANILLEKKQGTEKLYALNTAYLTELGIDISRL